MLALVVCGCLGCGWLWFWLWLCFRQERRIHNINVVHLRVDQILVTHPIHDCLRLLFAGSRGLDA